MAESLFAVRLLTSLVLFVFVVFLPECCTDQHFTRALHFHWTKTNPQNCTRQLSLIRGMKENVDLFGRLAIFQNCLCFCFEASHFFCFNLKTAIIPSFTQSVFEAAPVTQKGRRSMFFLIIFEQCCESYEL